MLYALPSPVLGQTHVRFQQVEVLPVGNEVILIGTYGTLDAAGAFAPEPRIQGVHRRISGKEYEAFVQRPVSLGLPAEKIGNFRSDDLIYWLDTYGYQKSTWEPAP